MNRPVRIQGRVCADPTPERLRTLIAAVSGPSA